MSASTVNEQPVPVQVDFPDDHRGRPFPTWAMIRTRIMELRKRRGLMVALVAVNIGIPVLYLSIRIIMHVVAPKSYGPAGGYDSFTNLVAGVMFVFGQRSQANQSTLKANQSTTVARLSHTHAASCELNSFTRAATRQCRCPA